MLLQAKAAAHGLPPLFVMAIVSQESDGEPYAWNPEPRYRYLWDVKRQAPFRALSDFERESETPPHDFPTLGGDHDQEWWAQQASWGLMQVMGAVARERGFRDTYLPALLDPDTNLEYGCRHLSWLFSRFYFQHGWAGVAAAYNAGAPRRVPVTGPYENQGYVDQVLSRMAKGSQR